MIELSRITKSFATPVLRGVDLFVPEGCLYGLIGPGAAGKSLILRLITGLAKPDSGQVFVDGQDVAALGELALQDFRRRFGMLFQNNALFDFMTVAENVAFPLRRLFDLEESAVAEKVAERLRAVSLGEFGHRMPAGLSGGQKKRVGVARATITGARIVLYDEPAAGLDPVTSQQIFNLLRSEQRENGSTVVMVSSDLDRLLTVTDRIGMLYDGLLIFEGTTEEARSSKDPYVRQFVHGETEGPL